MLKLGLVSGAVVSVTAVSVDKKSTLAMAEEAAATVLQTMRISHKTEYWGKIFMGKPAQEFTVIFDTGSGNLILPGDECQSRACLSHRQYQPSKSDTGMAIGKDGVPMSADPNQKDGASVRFGTGKIKGKFFQDDLCLGGQGSGCTTVGFIATTEESDSPFESCAFDGIMGLGFQDLSMGQGFNIVDDIQDLHSLPRDMFSVYLSDDGVSEITFGGYKQDQLASQLLWMPVTRESYWQIGIDDITFNNKKQNLCTDCQVAVDTGTSLLAGPSSVIDALTENLQVAPDCSNFDTLPNLGFAVGDKVLNLLPDDYIDREGGSCSLALMTLDVPPPRGPLFIFGDPFLRRFTTVYDRDGPKVGFAVAKHDDKISPSSLIADLDTTDAPKKSSKLIEQDDFADLPRFDEMLQLPDSHAQHEFTNLVSISLERREFSSSTANQAKVAATSASMPGLLGRETRSVRKTSP